MKKKRKEREREEIKKIFFEKERVYIYPSYYF
jgi:hypothetical protein